MDDVKMVSLLKEKYLDKEYEALSWKEVATAPVSAIRGVSKQDGEDLKKAFGIVTIRDLAANKYVALAQGINSFSRASGVIFDEKFNSNEYEELRKKPVHVIAGISEADSSLLKRVFGIDNIRELAENTFVSVAQTICTLGILEESAARMKK
jgi:hypothetical protein